MLYCNGLVRALAAPRSITRAHVFYCIFARNGCTYYSLFLKLFKPQGCSKTSLGYLAGWYISALESVFFLLCVTAVFVTALRLVDTSYSVCRSWLTVSVACGSGSGGGGSGGGGGGGGCGSPGVAPDRGGAAADRSRSGGERVGATDARRAPCSLGRPPLAFAGVSLPAGVSVRTFLPCPSVTPPPVDYPFRLRPIYFSAIWPSLS